MNLGCRGSSWKGTCWKPASPAQSRRLLKQSCLALPRQCVKSHICGAKVSASRTTHLHYARNERGFSYHTPKSGLIKYGSTYGPNDGLWLAGLLSPPSESKPSLSSGAISRPWLGCTARKAMGVASGIPNASNFSLKGGTFLYPIQESVIVVFLRRQSSASRSGYEKQDGKALRSGGAEHKMRSREAALRRPPPEPAHPSVPGRALEHKSCNEFNAGDPVHESVDVATSCRGRRSIALTEGNRGGCAPTNLEHRRWTRRTLGGGDWQRHELLGRPTMGAE